MASKQIVIGGVSSKELLMLVKQLHAAVKAGYNSAQALEIAFDQSKGRLNQILDEVIRDVKHGAYLYESFGKHEKYFPSMFLNLLKTGELSASLKESLERLVIIIEKERSLRQKFRSAMTYPIFVLVAVIGLGLSISVFVLPSLLPLFENLNVELPLTTRILMWFAKYFDTYGISILIGTIVFFIVLVWLIRKKFTNFITHWLMLKVPLFSRLTKQLIMARFGRSLASLLRSGIPIDESLKISTSVITNYYYQKVIKHTLPAIRKGQTLAESFAGKPHLFEDMFVKLLSLGEKTGGLEEACDNVADYYEGEVDEAVKNLTTSLEPILIIFVGIIVGGVAMSILGPIYKITGNLR